MNKSPIYYMSKYVGDLILKRFSEIESINSY